MKVFVDRQDVKRIDKFLRQNKADKEVLKSFDNIIEMVEIED